VVSGPPASGKSTLAPALAGELRLPLVAKDTIKDALMSVLPVPDVDASRQLGRAAVVAMLAGAAASPSGAVIESNFYRSRAVGDLGRLPGRVGSWRFSAVSTAMSRACDTRPERDPATRGTSTRSAPPRSSGTMRSQSLWPARGRSSRSTPPNPPMSPRSSAEYAPWPIECTRELSAVPPPTA
jgi:hypothetical protein